MSADSAMVRLKNTARPEEAKAIMPATIPPEGTASPIFRFAIKVRFRLTQDKFDRSAIEVRFENEEAFSTLVSRGVAKELEKRFLQKMRVDLNDLCV